MTVSLLTRGLCSAAAATAISFASATFALAETVTITDIAGRTVEVEKNPQKVVLGEGRMIYSIALLDSDNPFQRIVGWKDDMVKYDPDAYRKYQAVFPEAADIPSFGSPYADEWNLESVISLGTEVVLMNLGNLMKAQESGIIEKLEEAGVATVFVDFRQDPTQNTVPSIQLLGRIFDKRDEADTFTDYYQAQMKKIYSRVESIPAEDRPIVFIERAAGYNPAKCCGTFGAANLGRLVDLAGGRNWGSLKFPGFKTAVSLEAIFADDPEVIIGTGANWAEANPATAAVLFGYEASEDMVQERLGALAAREGWSDLSAVKNGNFHSIYHQFYNSPYHFVAMQAFAKWLHPDLFADLDPEATMIELHEKFLPIDYSGVFWGSLSAGG
ncbi:ABC transporter substrate-binding protein [Parasedimentitalea maritima]|uniref:ABC transporter substrate-binding protein n=2 Tax=Parasedimentitalea TaxID=2738399 RepID=A0A6L6WGW0_9RHOB|nr:MULTISPECIES: ABC transporter substrate-binding protein [Zongyanglinia]KAE9630391.1 ABC transporter substrate-binding protein [Zongyanglinia marina]MVO16169.1 ABC transporter substrate-binding protein [Zongyanglinia huanghaiensis]TLP67157.1 ABC transporter substrate-binding protein [Zongyanglinia marina]